MLPKFSVRKPLTVFVSVIMIFILGIISFNKMNTDLLPSMDLPYVIVITTYPGASPEKVEKAVTKPLEESLATTSNIKEINSSSAENSSMIYLEFEQGSDMNGIMLELNSKVDTVVAAFDDGIGSPILMKINPNMMPIMVASIDIDGYDRIELSNYVKDEIIPELERIDGVASISSTGIVEEEVHVNLNQEKIDELNKKILAQVDSKLADSKGQLDAAKSELENGKAELENQSSIQTQELADKTVEVQRGIDEIRSGINEIDKAYKEVEEKKAELEKTKTALELFLKADEVIPNLPIMENAKKNIELVNEGIMQCDNAMEEMNSTKAELNEKLNPLYDASKQLEIGKLTMDQELAKAQDKLTTGENELNIATEEFEKASKEAYKQAGLDSMITKDNISKILMAENFSMPAGYITENGNEYLVKVGEEFNSLEELKDLVLFKTDVDEIGAIKLSDVADVELTDNSEDVYGKINKNDGILLTFNKQSTSSTAAVCELINSKMDELMGENSDVHLISLSDQGVYIDMVIGTVLDNLIYGGILAVIILFIFLKNIKPTIIIAFSIPISLLFAIVLMYFSDVNLNIISLSGLALGVGMLVDNSIVVIENIYRLRNEGMDSAHAAVEGAKQVSGAIVASTLTTICVFLPIVFTQGLSRQLFTDMGLTIAYSLIASLIIALTLVPAMSSTLLKETKEKEHKLFNRFVLVYEKILRFSLKHRAIILSCVIGLLVLSCFLVVNMGTSFMPKMDSPQMSVSMSMPKESTIKDTREMGNEILDRILTIKEVETVGALEGSNNMFSMGGGSSNGMSYYILLDEDKNRSNESIKKEIEELTKDLECEIEVSASTMDMSAMLGSGITVRIEGNDTDKLAMIASDIANLLEKTEGTTDISDGLEESSKETRVVVNKNKAAEYGLTVAQVYQEIATVISNSADSTTLSIGVNDYPVIVFKDENKYINRSNLADYEFDITKTTGEEVKVKLRDIAEIGEGEALNSINHVNQVRTISVTAAVKDDYNIGLVSREFEKKLDNYSIPEGYEIELAGENEEINDTIMDLIYMVLLAISFIYFIMVAQFQSLLSPFIVLFTIPLAFTGGLLALFITGFELSVISMLGFLVLSGIIVNNGIVFVDYVNQLRISGMEKHEALIVAGKTRIRPILMTASTTILGLSTMALGIGSGVEMVQPMAIVTVGGLIYATALTLIVVPIIYDLLHRKKIKVYLKENITNES